MLEPYRDIMDSWNIVLVSGSPRRKQILEQLDLKFTCCESGYDERELCSEDFLWKNSYVLTLAKKKIEHVKIPGGLVPDVMIGADTIVVCDGEIYGKPATVEQAKATLKRLRGKTHEVFTGVALAWCNSLRKVESDEDGYEREVDTFVTRTIVKMFQLSDLQIDAYIKSGEPFDKAGGYGIQGLGGSFVECIKGDYYNVVGFPLHEFCLVVKKRIDALAAKNKMLGNF